MTLASPRQISYIQALREKKGRKPLEQDEIAGMTNSEASDMIERLTGKL